jgi:hypothetical protein
MKYALHVRSVKQDGRKNCNPQAEREETADGSLHCLVVARCRGKQEK